MKGKGKRNGIFNKQTDKNTGKNTGTGTHVEIPEGVTEIRQSAFQGNKELKSVYIHEGVCRIGSNAFAGCISLEELTLPASLQFWSWSAFSGCSSLRMIHVPAGSWVRQIPDILGVPAVDMDGNALPPIPVNDDDWRYKALLGEITVLGRKSAAAGTLYQKPGCITTLYIPGRIAGMPVTAIGENAFVGDEYIDALYLPDGLRTIGEGAFAYSDEMEMIRLPESLEHIGNGAFRSCAYLDSRFKERMHAIDDDYNDYDGEYYDEYEEPGRIWYQLYDNYDEVEDEAPEIIQKNVVAFRPRETAGGGKPGLDSSRGLSKPPTGNQIENKDMEVLKALLTKRETIDADHNKDAAPVIIQKNVIAFKPRAAAGGGKPGLDRFRALSKPLIGHLQIEDKSMEVLYALLTNGERIEAIKLLYDCSADHANFGLKWAKETVDTLAKLL